jgi:hypothetical protein
MIGAASIAVANVVLRLCYGAWRRENFVTPFSICNQPCLIVYKLHLLKRIAYICLHPVGSEIPHCQWRQSLPNVSLVAGYIKWSSRYIFWKAFSSYKNYKGLSTNLKIGNSSTISMQRLLARCSCTLQPDTEIAAKIQRWRTSGEGQAVYGANNGE